MRRVDGAEDFAARYQEASLEAEKAFSNPGLYLEKYIVDGRHIEFQVMADAYGARRPPRRARVFRAAAAPEAPRGVPLTRTRRGDARGNRRPALRGPPAVGYRNAGTVEFFRDPAGTSTFMEMNARLQVEHPVTEMITGRDLVAEQIRLAANEPLSFRQEEVRSQGHAIECRINAEDPAQDFRPSPGLIQVFRPPDGALSFEIGDSGGGAAKGGDAEGTAAQSDPSIRVRVDTHVRDGYRIPPHYDSLLAKIIVWGPTRDAARRGMIDALTHSASKG